MKAFSKVKHSTTSLDPMGQSTLPWESEWIATGGDGTCESPYCDHVKIAQKQARVKYDMAFTALTIIFRESVAQEAVK